MDTFDFSTIYMAVLTSNLLLAVIAIILRHEKIMVNAGYKLITIFLALTAVRFLLPIQFPFVNSLVLPEGISNIIGWIFTPLYKTDSMKITPMTFLITIWLIGILIQGYRYYRSNRAIHLYVLSHGTDVTNDSRYESIMKTISDKHVRFRIFEIPDLQTPLLCGFKTPYILMPVDFQCTDAELTYILKHELTHYEHLDLWTKFTVHMLSIIYWWNPFCYLLNNQVNLLLEMRIDDTVVGNDCKETLAYLQCLYRMAEYQNSILSHPMGNVICFSLKDASKMEKRFQMLIHKRREKNCIFNVILVILLCTIYLMSYLVIFEAYSNVNAVSIDAISFNEINSYLIDNENGTYDVYFAGIKIETLDSLENYSTDIPIYTMEEFEHVQQEIPE